MKQIDEADMDLFEVTPWHWVTFNEALSSNVFTKSNSLVMHLLNIIDCLLVEKIVLPNQTILMLYQQTYLKLFDLLHRVTPSYGLQYNSAAIKER